MPEPVSFPRVTIAVAMPAMISNQPPEGVISGLPGQLVIVQDEETPAGDQLWYKGRDSQGSEGWRQLVTILFTLFISFSAFAQGPAIRTNLLSPATAQNLWGPLIIRDNITPFSVSNGAVQLSDQNGFVTNFPASTDAIRGQQYSNAQFIATAGQLITGGNATLAANPTANIGKNGVRYWFPANTVLFRDAGGVIGDRNAAMSFVVDGMGVFTTGDANQPTINLQHESTRAVINCYAVTNMDTDVSVGCVYVEGGQLVLNVVDTMYAQSGPGMLVFDTASGNVLLNCPNIHGGSTGIELEGGIVNINARRIFGGNAAVVLSGGNSYISADEAISGSSTMTIDETHHGLTNVLDIRRIVSDIAFAGGTVRIVNARIEGTITVSAPGLILENCTIISGAANPITAGSAQTVTVIGSINMGGKVPHANITLISTNATSVLTVTDDPYNATTWNGNIQVPTKNAIRDAIEGLTPGGGGSVSVGTNGGIAARFNGSTNWIFEGATVVSNAENVTITFNGGTGVGQGVLTAVTNYVEAWGGAAVQDRITNLTSFQLQVHPNLALQFTSSDQFAIVTNGAVYKRIGYPSSGTPELTFVDWSDIVVLNPGDWMQWTNLNGDNVDDKIQVFNAIGYRIDIDTVIIPQELDVDTLIATNLTVTGTITGGNITTVGNGGSLYRPTGLVPLAGEIPTNFVYEAGQNMFLDPDLTTLWLFKSRGNGHAITNKDICIQSSSNGMASWSAAVSIITNSGWDVGNFSAGQNKRGDMFVMHANRTVVPSNPSTYTNVWVWRSSDRGVTWVKLTEIVNPALSLSPAYPAGSAWVPDGPIICQDGFLYATVYSVSNFAANASAQFFLRSAENDGTNWAVVTMGQTASLLTTEVALLGVGPNTIYASTRYEATSGAGQGRYLFQISTNNGNTWRFTGFGVTQFGTTTANPGRMALINNNVVLAFCDRTSEVLRVLQLPVEQILNATNWNRATVYTFGSDIEGGYCALVPVEPNGLHMIYYDDQGSITPPARLYGTNLTIATMVPGRLELRGGGERFGFSAQMSMVNETPVSDFTGVGFTNPNVNTNQVLLVSGFGSTSGGVVFNGFSGAAATTVPITMRGYHGAGASATVPPVLVVGAAHNGTTGATTVGGSIPLFAVGNNSVSVFQLLLDGDGDITNAGGIFPQRQSLVRTNIAQFDIQNNLFNFGVLYTNANRRSVVDAYVLLTAAVANAAQASLFVDQDANGTFDETFRTVNAPAGAILAYTLQLSAPLQPNARWMLTNQSGGTATVATNGVSLYAQ